MKDKLLIIQTAALGHDLLQQNNVHTLCGMPIHPIAPVFPAITCPFQASFRTGRPPETHGITANGIFSRSLRRTAFWEQSAHQIPGPRIWEDFRKKGRTVALLFWQQSLGESADFILSPAPIHKHHGGMIQDCFSKPDTLYPHLITQLKRPFRLLHYWGPLASARAGDWIAEATAEIIRRPDGAPDLCLTYLPTLDYDLQRHGPSSPQARHAVRRVIRQLEHLHQTAEQNGYRLLIIGDYAIGETTSPVFPNRTLREHAFFRTRTVRGMTYPNFTDSAAFVLADHEIAQVHILREEARAPVLELLGQLPGVESVQPLSLRQLEAEPPDTAPDAIMTARPGHWFAYPWWTDNREAPDYARHVDIHSKPGYDPCELFAGWPPGAVSLNPARLRGSHGRPDRPAAWAGNALDTIPGNTLELIEAVTRLLQPT